MLRRIYSTLQCQLSSSVPTDGLHKAIALLRRSKLSWLLTLWYIT